MYVYTYIYTHLNHAEWNFTIPDPIWIGSWGHQPPALYLDRVEFTNKSSNENGENMIIQICIKHDITSSAYHNGHMQGHVYPAT